MHREHSLSESKPSYFVECSVRGSGGRDPDKDVPLDEVREQSPNYLKVASWVAHNFLSFQRERTGRNHDERQAIQWHHVDSALVIDASLMSTGDARNGISLIEDLDRFTVLPLRVLNHQT